MSSFHFFQLARLWGFLRFVVLSLGVLMAGIPALAGVDVTTRHNDNARTGQNLRETVLNTATVNAATFGKVAEYAVNGRIWAQPLLLTDLQTPGHGVRDVVYVTTQNSWVYALDARPPYQLRLAERNLVQAPYAVDLVNFKTASVSSPVIDRASGTLYVSVKKYRGDVETGTEFWLHALDIHTLADKVPPVRMHAEVPGTGSGSVNGKLTFNAFLQKQRPALLLAGGAVYAGFGASVDVFSLQSIWNGWIMSYDAATLAPRAVRCIAPNANGGGVWQAGNGMAADSNNHIYAVTGTGHGAPYSFSVPEGGTDYGNSILRLVPNGSQLDVATFFAPFNYKFLELADRDVGSSGPMLLPNTNLLIAGDKTGRLYVVNRQSMGGYTPGSNQIHQDFQAWSGHLHGTPVYWNGPQGPTIYGWPEHDYLKAFRFIPATGRFHTSPVSTSSMLVPPGMPGGTLALTANGAAEGSGIVWSCAPYVGDANLTELVPGVVRAFDASDLKRELWNSRIIPQRDDIGYYAKFATPTVANGRLFVPTFSDKLVIFSLLPPAPSPPAAPALSAESGLLRVDLSWTTPPQAVTYTLQRGLRAEGPFSNLHQNLTVAAYTDSRVSGSTAYFYRVLARNSAGKSAFSNVVRAAPFAPGTGTAISLDFVGGSQSNGFPQPLGTTEKAGQLPLWYWNSAPGASGTIGQLVLNGGGNSGASATWSGPETGSTGQNGSAGDDRMMKGYLAATSSSGVNININNLPPSFTSAGYDLYLYSDGTNFSATRSTRLRVADPQGAREVTLTDPENRDFEGEYHLPGVAQVGNYALFSNLTSANLNVEVLAGDATDSLKRGALCGLQIVARQGPPASSTTPTLLQATAWNGTVSLVWTGVSGSSAYRVYRSQSPGGPFTLLGQCPTSSLEDVKVSNGTSYSYKVTALLAGRETAASNVATATPQVAYSGRILSVDFGLASAPFLAGPDLAGALNVRRHWWNTVIGPNGGLGDIKDDGGNATTADVSVKAGKLGTLPIPDTPGNSRMMRGYLITSNGSTQIDFYNLPPSFIAKGYDVFLYTDLYNPGASRTSQFTVNGNVFQVTDRRGADFSGTFVTGNSGYGNVLKISGQSGSRLSITATAASTDKSVGAPVNGIQLVARNHPSVPLATAQTIYNSPAGQRQSVLSTFQDEDGVGDMRVCFRVSGGTEGEGLLATYLPTENKLYLCDARGMPTGSGFAPESQNELSSASGTLHCAATRIMRQDKTISVEWAWTPSDQMTGNRRILLGAGDEDGNWSGWQDKAGWNISGATGPGPGTSAAPKSPSTGRN